MDLASSVMEVRCNFNFPLLSGNRYVKFPVLLPFKKGVGGALASSRPLNLL